jgi:hypothetical protein
MGALSCRASLLDACCAGRYAIFDFADNSLLLRARHKQEGGLAAIEAFGLALKNRDLAPAFGSVVNFTVPRVRGILRFHADN